MEASRTFNELITKIETSQLNFKIIKTPFSANIYLKSTFIKYFEQNAAPVSNNADNVTNNYKTEAIKLDENEKDASEDKVKLEQILKQERSNVKSLETELGELRNETLKIKKEKNILNSSLKACKTELEEEKVDKLKMFQVISDLETQLKVKCEGVKVKDIEYPQLENDNTKLEKLFNECSIELELAKKNFAEANIKKEYKCSHCDLELESKVSLSQHLRDEHFKNQVSQTKNEEKEENFEHLCFYCDHVITSIEDLKKHRSDCPVLDCQDKCDQCDSKFRYRTDLIDHFKSNHPEISIVWCDFCQAGYETLEELQSHIRMEHRNYLPG